MRTNSIGMKPQKTQYGPLQERTHFNCSSCRDFGAMPAHARECLVVCAACGGKSRQREYQEIHRVFDCSVPHNEIGTLNEKYGILYNDFLLGKMPPSFDG